MIAQDLIGSVSYFSQQIVYLVFVLKNVLRIILVCMPGVHVQEITRHGVTVDTHAARGFESTHTHSVMGH